jgi:SAM-dependent methyltransferase
MAILAEITSGAVLDAAYEWLCRRRRDYSANADVWGFRRDWVQCHIGLDMLRLARLGAVATGLDFSAAPVEVARGLAEQTGLKADFIQGTVDEAPRLTPGAFDLAFTTWGALCCLPEMSIWAKVIASALAPGGELYCADAHPGFSILEEPAGRLVPT